MRVSPRRSSVVSSFLILVATLVPAGHAAPANTRPRHEMIDNLLTTGSVHPRPAKFRPQRIVVDDGGGWLQLTITGRSGHAGAYDAARDRVLIFGGDDGEFRNDVWALSMSSTPPWKKLEPGGTPPTGRTGARALMDPANDRMLIFGGWDSQPNNDVWALSLADPPAWQPLAPTGTPPDSCGACAAVYDSARERLLVVQGSTLFALSLDSIPEWAAIGTGGAYPGDRVLSALEYDPVRDQLIVFGGDDGGFPLPDDVWALALAGTPQWSNITPAGAAPEGRFGATMTYDPVDDRMVVLGGSDGYAFFDDTWALSLSGSPAWSAVNPAGDTPEGRVLHVAVYDGAHERIVIFGGADDVYAGTDRNDAWALSLGADPDWMPLPGTSPSPRRDSSSIYDPVGDRMIVFGGQRFPDMLAGSNEVWSFSLDKDPYWSRLEPSGTPPAPRYGAMAIYDPPRERMVVFGGAESNDVWSLSLGGTTAWSPLIADGGAPPFADAAIHDLHRDRMLVFSGPDVWALTLAVSPQWTMLDPGGLGPDAAAAAIYDAPGRRAIVFGAPPDNDLYALSLSGAPAWTPLDASIGAPSARSGPLAVFDPVRDRMVIHGGYHSGELNDTHALSLDGEPSWAGLPSAELGLARSGHTGVYDSRRDRMLVFGGGDFYVEFNDVWALEWGAATTAPPAAFANSLGPGYPNPFNPRVTIPFELHEGARASLAVYDVSGHLVSTLVDSWTSRGPHTALWNGTNDAGTPAASGIYFCRLRAGAFTATRKLVLLR